MIPTSYAPLNLREWVWGRDKYANPQIRIITNPGLDSTLGSNSAIVEFVSSLENIKTDIFIKPAIINPVVSVLSLSFML
jgi:hypothetical protein